MLYNQYIITFSFSKLLAFDLNKLYGFVTSRVNIPYAIPLFFEHQDRITCLSDTNKQSI